LRVDAVVLRHQDWGEADRLLILYTLELGKVRAVGKGVRKLHSRKAGHLEPFTRVTLQLARGRSFFIVTQAETQNAFSSLREDLTAIGYASYVIELLDRFTYDEDQNGALFRLLTGTLGRLQRSRDPLLVLRYYEMRLLDYLGYRPELSTCVSCGEEVQPQDQYFSALQGGALCPSCGGGGGGGAPPPPPRRG
jgi:DNA repair protein RecO (recombination protein O)